MNYPRFVALTISIAAALPYAASAAANGTAGLDFGGPPSGRVPIYFNDRHVYAKPNELRKGRLLAALVRNGTILLPLRSMFEQLGATVAYDGSTKTATASKAGSRVSLTVGRPAITIDGQVRPLDVPPVIEAGVVLVPVRVISEAFGAYVQWVPEAHAVVVRYLAGATQPVPAPETPAPVAVLPPRATPLPRRTVGPGPALPKAAIPPETFVAVDPLIGPRVANEFSPNNRGASGTSYAIRAASDFNFLGSMLELDANYRAYRYAHNTGPVTAIGGGSTNVGAFVANDYQLDGHVGAELSPQKFYLAVGYTSQSGNYGYPRLNGLNFGINKLPVLDRKISVEGSFFYYPSLHGTCNTPCPTGPYDLSYRGFRYSAGLTALLGHSIFAEAGYEGDKFFVKSFAPSNVTHSSPFAGLGARL